MYALHSPDDAHVTQLYVLRGILEDRLKVTAQRDVPCYQCQTVEEMLDMYLRCNTFYTSNHVTTIKDRMPVCTPFPQFFDVKVDSNGDITGDVRPEHLGKVGCQNLKSYKRCCFQLSARYRCWQAYIPAKGWDT